MKKAPAVPSKALWDEKFEGTAPEWVVYYGEKGPGVKGHFLLLHLTTSVGDNRVVIAEKGGKIDRFTLKAKEFTGYVKVGSWDRSQLNPDVLEAPDKTAIRLLLAGKPITKAALDALEDLSGMETRGKSTTQIRAEVERLARELPKGHPLKAVPKQYPDRSAAIAAYASIHQLNLKEKSMATKKVNPEAAAEETKPTKATKASTKGGTTAEAKKASKAEVTKPTKATKKAEPKASKENTNSYVLAGDAAKVKTTEELGMHEDSIRTKVLSAVLGSKAKGGVPFANLVAVAGAQTAGAIAYLVKRGFLAVA